MNRSPFHDLSRRERQIMEIVHRFGEAAVSEVVDAIDDSVSYNSVRVTMAHLEDKGYLRHVRDGRRFLYRSTQRMSRARNSAARHLLTTFFADSLPDAVSTLLDVKTRHLSDEDFERLAELIEDARRRREQDA